MRVKEKYNIRDVRSLVCVLSINHLSGYLHSFELLVRSIGLS